MNTTIDDTQLKRAWQTAFELRLCPDGIILFAETPDENLHRHLQMCHICREKREMPLAQRAAWEELQRRFAGVGQKPARPEKPVAGQVWSLKRSLAGWIEEGYFYKPPMVLLLERIEGSRGFKAVQLYGDRLLMGEGDVWLDDRFGFAQGWNCYSLHEDAFDGCWGAVAGMTLNQVAESVSMKHAPVDEDSILYFFRRMEIKVGARVALPSVAVLVEKWETSVEESVIDFFKRLFPVEAVKNALTGWRIPDGVVDVFQLAVSAVAPSKMAPLKAANKTCYLQANYIRKKGESVIIEPLLTEITFTDWHGGGYLVSGRLAEPFANPVQLLAVLSHASGQQIQSEPSTLTPETIDFDIFFKGVSRAETVSGHLQLLVVSYA
ncbi:hypothetical protein [Pelobacter propionicus]|uniref:Uncharacterized protein n=1 Tax=Pelobacter propionicus (strain DSM 2379 / NBRC 103807 / OttBd1) TaxID=338966 RepID=A1AKD0_PELPD|nr:hypothetical protein [Pelobacter propionicus]ABK97800.1 hypothetical protein Ppro_0164 [Pelobacter propionicus DSM 2379]